MRSIIIYTKMLMSSGLFESKHSHLYTTNDTHPLFTRICTLVTALDQLRIVQKIARPIPYNDKVRLMSEVNQTLDNIRLLMDEVKYMCRVVKGKEEAVVQDVFVTAQSWKSGIRKIQGRLTTFYEARMKHFRTVNENAQLNLQLREVNQKEWAKECFSKLTPFCICG